MLETVSCAPMICGCQSWLLRPCWSSLAPCRVCTSALLDLCPYSLSGPSDYLPNLYCKSELHEQHQSPGGPWGEQQLMSAVCTRGRVVKTSDIWGWAAIVSALENCSSQYVNDVVFCFIGGQSHRFHLGASYKNIKPAETRASFFFLFLFVGNTHKKALSILFHHTLLPNINTRLSVFTCACVVG